MPFFLKIIFIYLFAYVCVCMCTYMAHACVHVCSTAHMQRSKDNLWELILSYLMDLRITLGSKQLYPLGYLTSCWYMDVCFHT